MEKHVTDEDHYSSEDRPVKRPRVDAAAPKLAADNGIHSAVAKHGVSDSEDEGSEEVQPESSRKLTKASDLYLDTVRSG